MEIQKVLTEIQQDTSRPEFSPLDSDEIFYSALRYISDADDAIQFLDRCQSQEIHCKYDQPYFDILPAAYLLCKMSNTAMAIALLQESPDLNPSMLEKYCYELLYRLGTDIEVSGFNCFTLINYIPDPRIVYGLNVLKLKIQADRKRELEDETLFRNATALERAGQLRKADFDSVVADELKVLLFDTNSTEDSRNVEFTQKISELSLIMKSLYGRLDPFMIYNFAMRVKQEQVRLENIEHSYVFTAWRKRLSQIVRDEVYRDSVAEQASTAPNYSTL